LRGSEVQVKNATDKTVCRTKLHALHDRSPMDLTAKKQRTTGLRNIM